MKISRVTHLRGDRPRRNRLNLKKGFSHYAPFPSSPPPGAVRPVVVTILRFPAERGGREDERRAGSDYIKQHFPAVP